jgi:hypothetical protein
LFAISACHEHEACTGQDEQVHVDHQRGSGDISDADIDKLCREPQVSGKLSPEYTTVCVTNTEFSEGQVFFKIYTCVYLQTSVGMDDLKAS